MAGAPIASEESVRARALQLCTVLLQAGASAAALKGRLQPSRCFVRRRAWASDTEHTYLCVSLNPRFRRAGPRLRS